NDAVKELNGISTAYGDLKKQVDDLDTGDQGEFADGLKDIAGELSKISKSGNEALEKLQSGEVGEAMKNQESCKSSTTSPAPSPSGA
ncbi:small secreted protein, partial [Streptomyces sp. NRRL F-6602]